MSKSNLPKREQPRDDAGRFGSLPTRLPSAPTPKPNLASSQKLDATMELDSDVLTQGFIKSYELYKNRIQKKGRTPILSKQEYLRAFLEYSVEERVAQLAAERLATNPPVLFATSGKLASGKDTITKALILELAGEDHSHVSLSTAMKDEAQEVLNTIRSSDDKGDAIEMLLEFNITQEQAKEVVESVYDFAKAEQTVTTRERTPWIRALLQYWATEVRRAQDKDYWTKKTIASVAEMIANGKDVIITDIRVPDEVERLQTIGFTIIRLDITPEVQADRLMGRDGLAIDPKAASHPTEVALDDFPGFNIRVENNDVSIEELVSTIIESYRS